MLEFSGKPIYIDDISIFHAIKHKFSTPMTLCYDYPDIKSLNMTGIHEERVFMRKFNIIREFKERE
jgi:hypothetical protein